MTKAALVLLVFAGCLTAPATAQMCEYTGDDAASMGARLCPGYTEDECKADADFLGCQWNEGSSDCVVCTSEVPACEEGCQSCEVILASCTACAAAVCNNDATPPTGSGGGDFGECAQCSTFLAGASAADPVICQYQ